MKSYDIMIIGGGASGLIAAISAKIQSPALSVAILERMDRVGKKLLATGNGRCNITNESIAAERYHSRSEQHVMPVLGSFDLKATTDLFYRLGVLFKTEENGKIYPYSMQASSVLDVLRFECERLLVDIICNSEVKSMTKEKGKFHIKCENNEFLSRNAIIATGGKSCEKLGSNGSGYALLKSFGHSATKLYPAIVPIKTETQRIKALKGIKTNALVTIKAESVSKSDFGEVLFTEYGLSGPPILQLSRIASEYSGSAEVDIILDMMPEYDFAELLGLLNDRVSATPNRQLENLFTGMLNKRIGQAVIKSYALELSGNASALTPKEKKSLVSAIKGFRLRVTGVQGFGNAQVTAGGMRLDEFHGNTLESRFAKGLFACGEVLDVDGDCGGFNLQWAWSSGFMAGKNAATS